jgi:hypothetical protein
VLLSGARSAIATGGIAHSCEHGSSQPSSTPCPTQSTSTLRISRYSRIFAPTSTVKIDEVPGYRTELTPFGGIGDSGLGVKGVRESVRALSVLKLVSYPWS